MLLFRNYIGKLMEQVKKGITFRHMDETGAEQSEHLESTKDDLNQLDDLATVFTPAVLKVCWHAFLHNRTLCCMMILFQACEVY